MKLQKILIPAAIILAFTFFSCVFAQDLEDRKDQEKIKMLLDAAYQAAFPAESMRIEFIYEDVNPLLLSFKKRPADEYAKFKREYTITVSGIRSRVEWHEEIFKPRKSIKQPALTRNLTWVFDGTWQLKLKDIIKPNPRTIGYKYTNNQNFQIITDEFRCWPFDLREVVSDERYPCELVESNKSGIYIVDVGYKDTGARYRFTIDSNKGYNITEYKFIRKDGSLIREVNYEIEKHPYGIWYMAGYELIRHPRIGKEGEPKIDHKVKVTKAEFNIDVPDETFKLEFPLGTKIWDDIIKDWYYLGTPEEVSDDEIVPNPLKTDNAGTEKNTKSSAEQKPSGQKTDTKTQSPKVQDIPRQTQPAENATIPLFWLVVIASGIILLVIFLYFIKTRKA